MKTAKVILRKALTYKINKIKFRKDEPQILTGAIVDQLLTNSYFSVTLLKDKSEVTKKKLKKKLRRKA